MFPRTAHWLGKASPEDTEDIELLGGNIFGLENGFCPFPDPAHSVNNVDGSFLVGIPEPGLLYILVNPHGTKVRCLSGKRPIPGCKVNVTTLNVQA